MLKRHKKVLAGIGLVIVACLLVVGIRLAFADTSPTITGVTPSAGGLDGGGTVAITGTNFRNFSSSATLPATANAWSAAAKTTTVQQGQTATAVINGKVYIYGGNANGTAIQVANVSDPTSFTTSPNTLPVSVSGASVIRLGDKLYIYSGHILAANVSDPTIWQDLGAMTIAKPFARQVMVIGDKIYLFGAGASSNAIYSAPVSDPTDLTDTGATLPGTRMFASFLNDGTYLYMLGGETDTSTWCRSNVNTIYKAPLSDPTSWTDTGKTLPVALATAVPVVLGNTAYLVGGCTPSGGANVNTIYSASLSDLTTWTDTGKTLPAALGNSGSVIANGNIYVYGGINASGTAVGAIYYAPLTQTGINYDNAPWTTDLPGPLSGVTFGGTAATNVQYINASTILATAPAHTAGTVDIAATDGTQTATLPSDYTYMGPPAITGLSPASGPISGGQSITITGSNFRSGDMVTFGGITATASVVSPTQITATVPAASAIHKVDVVVTDDNGNASTAATYTYALPAPSISSISPSGGPVLGGQAVTVTGSGFLAPNSTANSWTTAAKSFPVGVAGASLAVVGDTIYSYGGNATGGWTGAIYTAPVSDPTNWTLASKSLPGPLGNSSLAIIGDTMYLFGGSNGSSYTNAIYTASVNDPLTWTTAAKTLPARFGIAQLAVVGNTVYLYGGWTGSAAINTIYTAPVSDPTNWTLASKTLPTALQQSQIVTIGTKLYMFGGNDGTNWINTIYEADASDPTSWSIVSGKTLPTTLGGSRLVVVGNNIYLLGGAVTNSTLTNAIYTASTSDPLSWTTVSGKTIPGAYRSGMTAVIGNNVYYYGGYDGSALKSAIFSAPVTRNYPNQYNPSWLTDWSTDTSGAVYDYHLTLGGAPATQVSVTDSTHLTAITAAHAAGAVDVQASTFDGSLSNTLTGGYSYNGPPVIDNFSPTSEAIGASGDSITITGSGFKSGATVTFGGVSAVVTNVTDTAITATIPTGIAVNKVTITVANPDTQSTSASDQFVYTIPTPAISSISPAQGPVRGDTPVTVTGSGFLTPNSTTSAWAASSKTLPAGIYNSAEAVIGDKIYMFGGYNGSAVTNAIYTANVSDPTTWTIASNTLPSGLGASLLAVVGNELYMFGGYNGSVTTNAIYTASTSDPTNWTLVSGKTLPAAVQEATLAVVGGKLYIFGGRTNGTSPTNAIYSAPLSDPTDWSVSTGTLPTTLYASHAAVIGNEVYLFGGYTTANPSIATNAIYTASINDPTTWTTSSGVLPAALSAGSLVTIGNSLYLLAASTTDGANTYGTKIYTASVSSPTAWTDTGKTLPTALHSSQIVVVDNNAYLYGGWTTATTSSIYTAPVTHTFPNQYNPSWTTNWYTDATGSYNYHLQFGGINATNVVIADATHLTAVTPAHTVGGVDIVASNDAATQSSTLANGYTYVAPKITGVTPSNGPATGGQNVQLTGTNLPYFGNTTGPTTANAWSNTGKSIPIGNQSSLTAVIGNTIYIFGNDGNATAIMTAPISSPTTWTNTGKTLPAIGSVYAQFAEIGNSLYIFSGTNIMTAKTSDPTSWTLSQKTLPASARNATFKIVGDTMYLFGGEDNKTQIMTAKTSDPTSWTVSSATLPAAYAHGSIVSNGSSLFLLGGLPNSNTTATNRILTAPLSNPLAWTVASNTLPAAVGAGEAVVLGSTAYLIGGINSNCSNAIYSASLSDLTTWTNTGKTLPTGYSGSGFAIANGGMYLFGGSNCSNVVGTIYTAPLTQLGTNYHNDPWMTDLPGPVNNVTFDGISATNITYQPDSGIFATTPAHAAGVVNVTASDTSEQSSTITNGYTYNAPPVVDSFSPLSASIAGGDTVTITGSNFVDGATVTIGGTPATVQSVSATQIVVTIPVATTPGPVTLTVTSPDGQSADAATQFAYKVPQPSGLSISPTYSDMAGQGTLTITGDNFVADQGGTSWYTVTVDGTVASNTHVVNGTTLTATIPAHAPGDASVVIGGQDVDGSATAGTLTYLPHAYSFTSTPQTVMAGGPAKLTIGMFDSDNNPITSSSDVTLQLSSDSDSSAFATSPDGPWSSSSIAIPAGQTSVDVYYRDYQEGTPTVTAQDALHTAATQTVTIGAPYRIIVTGVTNPTNVGVPSSVTVEAVDYTGTPQASYHGTIHFTSTDAAATLPADYTFTANDVGRHTFTNAVVFGTQGTWDVTAADTQESTITGTQADIVAGAPALGTIAGLTFGNTLPQSFSLDDTSDTITVQLLDAGQNPVVADSDTTVYLKTDDSSGEFSVDNGTTWHNGPLAATIPADNNFINVTYRDTAAGQHQLTAAEYSDNNFGWTPASGNVTVGVGAPKAIQLDGPTATIGMGDWVAVAVHLIDKSGNIVNAPADTPIHLAASNNALLSLSADGSSAASSLDATIANGQQTATVYVQATSGSTVTVTGTDGRGGDTPYTAGSYTGNLGPGTPYGFTIAFGSDVPYDSGSKAYTTRVHDIHKATVSLTDLYGDVTTTASDAAVELTASDTMRGADAGKEPDSQFSKDQTGWTDDLTTTVLAGNSSQTVYYRHMSVKDGIALTAHNDDLNDRATTVNAVANLYHGKLNIVSPIAEAQDALYQRNSSCPAGAPANTTPSNGDYVSSYDPVAACDKTKPAAQLANDDTDYQVELLDNYGNPTTTTTSVTVGLGSDNLASFPSSSQYGSGQYAHWTIDGTQKAPAAPTPNPYNVGSPNEGPTAPAPIAPGLSTTIPAGQSSAAVTYTDKLAGAPKLTAWDMAFWQATCSTKWGSGCLEFTYRNASMTSLRLAVNANMPTYYLLDTGTTAPDVATTVVNTPSSDITVSLADAYGNATAPFAPDAGNPNSGPLTADLSSSSDTGIFLNASEQPITSLTFNAGVGTQTVRYKDSTVSPTTSYQYTLSATDATSPAYATAPATGTAPIRVIAGYPSHISLDFGGETSAAAGDYVPATVTTQTQETDTAGTPVVDGNGNPVYTPAVVLSNATVSLAAGDGQFYTCSGTPGSGTCQAVSSVVVAKNSSTVSNLYFRDDTVGQSKYPAVSASGFQQIMDPACTDQNQVVHMACIDITPAGVYQLGFTRVPDSNIRVATASGAFVVSSEDMYGNVMTPSVDSDTAVTLASSQSSGSFSTTSASGRFSCSDSWNRTLGVTIRAGQTASSVFYYCNGALNGSGDGITDASVFGTQTLTASSAGLQNATTDVKIVGDTPAVVTETASAGSDSVTLTAGTSSGALVVKLWNGDNTPAIVDQDTPITLNAVQQDSDDQFGAAHGADVFTPANVKIAQGQSATTYTLQSFTAGKHRIEATAFDGSTNIEDYLNVTVSPGTPDHLVAPGAPQSIYPLGTGVQQPDPEETTSSMPVYLSDQWGNYTSDQTSHTVQVSSSCARGAFYASATSQTTITQVTIGGGQQTNSIFYRDPDARATSCAISFTDDSLPNNAGADTAQQDVTVVERVYELGITSSPQTVEAGETSAPITVVAKDRYGNVITPGVKDSQPLTFTAKPADADSPAGNNVLTPSVTTIAAGQNTTQFTFRHTAAVTKNATYLLTACDPSNCGDTVVSPIYSADQTITVESGAPTKLAWRPNSVSGAVGDWLSGVVVAQNAYGLTTMVTADTTVNLQIPAGAQGRFASDSSGNNIITSTSITEGDSASPTVYYQPSTTTQTYDLNEDDQYIATADHPIQLTAQSTGLGSGALQLSAKPCRLAFSSGGSMSVQLSAFTPMHVSITNCPVRGPLTVALTADTASGTFYSVDGDGACPGKDTSTTELSNRKITSIGIATGAAASGTFCYRQTYLTSLGVARIVQAQASDASFDTWDAYLAVSTYLGAVDHIAIISGPSSLEQNQSGIYTIQTQDNLNNPTALVPNGASGSVCIYLQLTDASAAHLSGGSCSGVGSLAANQAVVAMRGGQTDATVSLHVDVGNSGQNTTGVHTLTVSNQPNMTGQDTWSGQRSKAIAITAAHTTALSFDSSTYLMKRGTVQNMTLGMFSDYGAAINTLGDATVTLDNSTGGEVSLDDGATWQSLPAALTIPADKTSLSLQYRNTNADVGTSTFTAAASGLTGATATLNTVIGSFSDIIFTSPEQTLERQQAGTFSLQLVDSYGNPALADESTCVYLEGISETATVTATQSAVNHCVNTPLPDGSSTAYAVWIPANADTASFTVSDTADGTHVITASTAVSPQVGDPQAQQTVTIVAGEPVTAAYAQPSYVIERGQVLTLTVQLENAYGAVVPATEDTSFVLTSSAGSGQFATDTDSPYSSALQVTIAAGQDHVTVVYGDTDPHVGDYVLTVHHVDQNGQNIVDDPIADTTTPLTVIYGDPAQLVWSTNPRTTIATHPSEVMTAQLLNAYGAPTVATANMKLQLHSDSATGQFATSTDGQWGITNVTIPSGGMSVAVYYKDPTEGLHQITVAQPATAVPNGQQPLTATQPHTIIRQVMDHFVVTNISTPQQAGTPSSVVVFAVDSDGYVVAWYTGTIHFSADTADAVYPQADYTFTAADKGTRTFTNAIAFKQSGVKAITVTDDDGLTGTQYNILVSEPNTNPVRSITFIAPQPQPINGAKNVPTSQLVLQLRDADGAPTTPTDPAGFPLHLTSDSATGQFATSPSGPWSSTLDTVVVQGLSYGTTPVYYRDSTGGQHTITAADWQNGVDDSTIQNATLGVHIDEFAVGTQMTLYSQDYSGAMRQNYYLFSNNKGGTIRGYAKLQLTATSIETGDSVPADWALTLTGGKGNTVERPSFAQQPSIQYQTPPLTPLRTDGDYTVATTVTAGQLTGSSSTALPVSPWLAALDNVSVANQALTASVHTYRDGNLADVPYGDVILPDAGTTWSFATLQQKGQLSHPGTGAYILDIPFDQSAGNSKGSIAVSLRDPFGIIAQDSAAFGNPGSVTPPAAITAPPPAEQPATPTSPEPITRPADNNAKPAPVRAINGLKRFLRSPQAPTIVSGTLFGLLLIAAAILLYQAYKEWRRARWLAAIVKRNNQIVADKDTFLALAVHHLRTPVTLMRSGAELLATGTDVDIAASVGTIQTVAEKIHQHTEQILADATNASGLRTITAQNPQVARAKIIGSPLFWLPVILSVLLTLLANWAIRTFGERTISGTQMLNQIFFLILSIVVAYTATRLLYMRREQRRLLAEAEAKSRALNDTKAAFVRRVYQDLASDVIQADAGIADTRIQQQAVAYKSIAGGVEHLKQLVSRFALLDSVQSQASVTSQFTVDYAVDEALHDLGDQLDASRLHVTDNAQQVELTQDKHLVVKVLETILASMRTADPAKAAAVVIDGRQGHGDTATFTVTGPLTDTPAEELFSVYSTAENEAAGTIDDTASNHRLDLYLDRIIVQSLGGSINATKLGDHLRVSVSLPAAA